MSYSDEDEFWFIRILGANKPVEELRGRSINAIRLNHKRLLEKYIEVNKDRLGWGKFIEYAKKRLVYYHEKGHFDYFD